MANIAKKLSQWEREGLLTLQQTEDIMEYENKEGKPWVMYGFITLGITIISIGIVSLLCFQVIVSTKSLWNR